MLAFSRKSTWQGHKHRTMPRTGGEIREENAGTHIRGWTCDRKTPQGTTGTWVQAKGGKGRGKPAWERQQTQAHGAGRGDERQRLVGRGRGGGGRRPGGRRFAPGKEVGSRSKLRGLQKGMATDGEELGNSGNIAIHKTGEEKGGVWG